MSDKIDDGGPAFPHSEDDRAYQGGMSLRDWFAGQALAGMHARDTYDDGQATPEKRAHLAYLDSNAMLKAREALS